MSWDESLVDFEAPPDGRVLSAIGGASGNMRLVNGQKLRFPWKAQEEIADSVPPRVQSYEEVAPGISHKLILLIDGAGFPGMDSYPQIELESTFADDPSGLAGARGEPAVVLYSGTLTGNDAAVITLQGSATGGVIQLSGNVTVPSLFTLTAPSFVATTISNPAATNLAITCSEDLAISTTGVGDTITVTSADTLALSATGAVSISSAEDITISTTGAGDDLILDPTGALTATGSSISLVSDGNGNVTITASGTGDLALTGAPVTINSVDVSTALGQWTDYTPTVTQSVTVSKTVTYSRYVKLGRTVIFEFYLVATSSGTATHALTVTLPVTAAQSALPVGMFYWYTTVGTDLNYVNPAYLASTTTMGGIIHGATTVFGNTQAGWPDQVVSGDSLLGFIIYEAAS